MSGNRGRRSRKSELRVMPEVYLLPLQQTAEEPSQNTEVKIPDDTELVLPDDTEPDEPDPMPVEFPPKPVLVRQPATYGQVSDLPDAYNEKMQQIEVSINRMEQMMTTILGSMHQQQELPSAVEVPVEELPVINLADWPVQKLVPENYDALHSRREYTTRSIADVYANEIDKNVDENIVLTDASASRWGAASRMQTNVGMRTRGLWLNPTLQQPSIGGLL